MNPLQPQYTLEWAAAHKFDQVFYAKYSSGELSLLEYLDLIEVSISHVHWVYNENPVQWYRFKARFLRGKRIDNLNKLRDAVYNRNWHRQ